MSCTTNAECTEGTNGRCDGNSHDGWQCTYDQCFDDGECGDGVCECQGGFRSDNNICLQTGNCRLDADCGGCGFCSPTLGDCGDYLGTVGYYCHTPADECVDDSDCAPDPQQGGPPHCSFAPAVGHWKCSYAQCVG